MQKVELLIPGKVYRIVQYSNADELIFLEKANEIYFQMLIEKHLLPVCEILDFKLRPSSIELILKFHSDDKVSEKFRGKLHLPLSNLLNSYAKSINKRYNRKGSLFRKRFERTEILT
jgi:putative transposase